MSALNPRGQRGERRLFGRAGDVVWTKTDFTWSDQDLAGADVLIEVTFGHSAKNEQAAIISSRRHDQTFAVSPLVGVELLATPFACLCMDAGFSEDVRNH